MNPLGGAWFPGVHLGAGADGWGAGEDGGSEGLRPETTTVVGVEVVVVPAEPESFPPPHAASRTRSPPAATGLMRRMPT